MIREGKIIPGPPGSICISNGFLLKLSILTEHHSEQERKEIFDRMFKCGIHFETKLISSFGKGGGTWFWCPECVKSPHDEWEWYAYVECKIAPKSITVST